MLSKPREMMIRRECIFPAGLAALLMLLLLHTGSDMAGAYYPEGVSSFYDSSSRMVECARIEELGIHKQTNARASEIMRACGRSTPAGGTVVGGRWSVVGAFASPAHDTLISPLLGGPDANIIQTEGAYPKVTQTMSYVWDNGTVIVVAYVDGRASPGCYAGGSYSTDRGATWNRIGGSGPSPFCSGHGASYGYGPTVAWNAQLARWYYASLASGCGGQGIGLWESTDGINWTAGACAHNGSMDDRHSQWVDNNPSSPYYGRIYISWNDFASSQRLFVTYSDDGTTWSVPSPLNAGFIRNVQVTGDSGASGTLFVAGMNEGGGGANPRQNLMYRSTDGGVTWTQVVMGPPFPAPGDTACGYFRAVNPNWKFMGWGQPAVGPGGMVHYIFGMHGAGSDISDIYYTRSTDNGTTWSAPMRLDGESAGSAQWAPSLAATANGGLLASWYDRRNSTNGTNYERWGRVSLDNGATWQNPDAVSDVLSPHPLQPDPSIGVCDWGDYDYSTAFGNTAYVTWTDGRNLIDGNAQQDVYFDKVPLAQGTPTLTPTATPTACNANVNYTVTQATGTVFPGTNIVLGSQADDAVIPFALPFPVQLYGQTYNAANLSTNGNMQFTTSNLNPNNSCLPASGFGATIFSHWDDLDMRESTCGARCGIFTDVSGPVGSRTLIIQWKGIRPDVPGSSVDFAVRIEEETANDRFEIIYTQALGNGVSATVGVQNIDGTLFTQFSCNNPILADGMRLVFIRPHCDLGTPSTTRTSTATIATSSPTTTTVPPTSASTFTSTVSPTSTPMCDFLAWQDIPAANIGSAENRLKALAVVSSSDVWAVGYYGPEQHTLIEHWDGTRWSVISNPTISTNYTYLNGVAAVAANDVWAVGTSGPWSIQGRTLIQHWDGTLWNIIPSPNQAPIDNQLNAVAAISSNDVWAVGQSFRGTGSGRETLIMHWDGTQWTIVPSPNTGVGNNILYGVAAISSDDIWAAGIQGNNNGTNDTLLLHWDGVQWSVIPAPSPGTDTILRSISAVGTDDVWAVGYYYNEGITQTLTLHWNGSAWTIVPSPNIGTGINFLEGLTAISSDDVWAVGSSPTEMGRGRLILHWQGSGWGVVPSPDIMSTNDGLNAVAATGPDNVWAVGFRDVFRALTHWYSEQPQFTDVPPGSTFYPFVHCLACRGIVSGYSDGTFRPNNPVTRGQLAKMVSNAAGFNEAVSGQTFQDVPPANTFYEWIERLTTRGYMTGYVCGGPGEPCVNNRPYFRPFANATRGQTAKIVANAAMFTEPPSGQTFEDVSPIHTFYEFIQRLASRNVMQGYACGGPGEPCTTGRPYFRPQNDVTRGQSAKIVANAFFPGCDPARR